MKRPTWKLGDLSKLLYLSCYRFLICTVSRLNNPISKAPCIPQLLQTLDKVTYLLWALEAHKYCSSATDTSSCCQEAQEESIWYIVTLYVNMRADLHRTIMRINPEYYMSLCVCLRCRGFPSHFANLSAPTHWVGWIHLNKVWGNTRRGWRQGTVVGKHLIG